ncbi:MAG: SRPBCC domain-containing protein [Anaerolineae bacterium]|nr:SRPBCC domain-containing protein [Anaerolineae bacterium]
MHELETQIEIAAPVERVWSLLIDFASHSRWNPFIRYIEGTLEVGQPLKVFIQPPGSNGMRFRPTVLAVEPNRELRWKGKLILPGLFDGEHSFRLESKPGGTLLFRQGEKFSGILVPLFRRSLDGATKQGFVAMNEALKREAEKP